MVIDATASLHVRSKLEAVLKDQQRTVPIAAMMVSGRAQHAAMVLSPVGYSGGPLDLFRRLGLSGHESLLAKALGACVLEQRDR